MRRHLIAVTALTLLPLTCTAGQAPLFDGPPLPPQHEAVKGPQDAPAFVGLLTPQGGFGLGISVPVFPRASFQATVVPPLGVLGGSLGGTLRLAGPVALAVYGTHLRFHTTLAQIGGVGVPPFITLPRVTVTHDLRGWQSSAVVALRVTKRWFDRTDSGAWSEIDVFVEGGWRYTALFARVDGTFDLWDYGPGWSLGMGVRVPFSTTAAHTR